MKTTGIVRKVDEQGRIVLPAEVRKMLKYSVGTSLEMQVEDKKIVIKKYDKTCTCCGCEEQENLRKVGDTYLCLDCIEKFCEQ